MIIAIGITFLLAVFAIIIALGALKRADRALGITTWTDLGTEIHVRLLRKRFKDLDIEEEEENARKNIEEFVSRGGGL